MLMPNLLLTCVLLAPPHLVEAESFDDLGGWVVDQQFMDLMGSPMVLAHGIGRPVADATTVVHTTSGPHRVWVRTRNWVAPWSTDESPLPAPGRFEVHVEGTPLDVTFGEHGDAWAWHDGGVVDLDESTTLTLHDLTGFNGRCDAIALHSDLHWTPPEDAALQDWRDALAAPVQDMGPFDLIVVGGGTAGCSAAITAARSGLTVALVQNRPVLGGNSSSEVRVWPEGHVQHEPYPAIGSVVMELIPAKGPRSKNAQAAVVFDDDRKLDLIQSHDAITLLLDTHVNGVELPAKGGHINAVLAQNIRTGQRLRLHGELVLDSTGDGCVGALAGADFAITTTGHMGASNLWNIRCLCEDEDPLGAELEAVCEDATFPRCPWALDLSDRPFPGREWGKTVPVTGKTEPISIGNWYWESGFDLDSLGDMERIRDYNLRAIFGAWDAIKNVDGRFPAHRLDWVAYIAGKRESRRLLGDVVVQAEDPRDGRVFEDGCYPCTWGIDTHFPHPNYVEGFEDEPFIADYTRGAGYDYDGPWWGPYRSLYSRTVDNLFMAGRNISVTHEALGAVRVMKTTGCMGEVVGMAAAVCREHDCLPRDVYTNHLDELKARMRKGV